MSSNDMPKEPSGRIELLQGTLDMLILRTLLFGPAHGHQIAKHIQRTTDDLLQVEHGSLVPTCQNWRYAIPPDRLLTRAAQQGVLSHERKGVVYANFRKLVLARIMRPAEEG